MTAGRQRLPDERAEPRVAAAGSLVGREGDIAAVVEALDRAHLVTLLGPGGVGKTSLALRVADDVHDRFPDGVVVVYLAALADAALVLPQIAQGIGVRDSGNQPLGEVLQQALLEQRRLLVLDNFEHVLAAALDVAKLLDCCAHLTILATSRVPLGLPREQRYTVAPLVQPDADVAPTVEVVNQAAAAQLFIQRARMTVPEFMLTMSNVAAVAALCRRLDGLPLAIELAAAQLDSLSISALAARLDETLPLLAGEAHRYAERHQTMWRAIAWSHRLLAEDEQALFRQLAVFAGGCTLEAVAAVCPATNESAASTQRTVLNLVDKSLLRVEERPHWDAPRLMMLETIRAYALERLAHSGEEEECRRRQARYFLALAQQAEPALTGPEQGHWVTRLEAEHDNLRAVLRWALAPGANRADAGIERERIVLGLQLGAALWRFWYMRGYLSEGRDWLERLAACPIGTDDREMRKARAWVLTDAGLLALYQSDLDQAALLCGQSLPIFEALGDQHGIARALFGAGRLEDSVALYRQLGETRDIAEPLLNLALIALQQGNDSYAAELYEESLKLARQRDDRHGIALALGGLGLIEGLRKGDHGRATALHEESLELYRELGDTRGIAIALSNLAEMASMAGEYSRARAYVEECIPLRRQVGDRFGLADSLNALADIACAQGDYRRAEALHEDSVSLFRQLGDKRWLTHPLRDLANVLYLQGSYGRAQALFEELMAISQEIGDRHGQAYALDGLGLVAAAHGDYGQARALHEEALALYRMVKDRFGIAGTLSYLGTVALQQGNVVRAAGLQRESLALFKALGIPRAIATVLCHLGDARQMEGDLEQARAAYVESLTISHRLGLLAGIARALAGMAFVAEAAGKPGRAVRLAGAAKALQETVGAVIPPAERSAGEGVLVALRAELGENAYAAAWTEGRALSPEQAIAEALGSERA